MPNSAIATVTAILAILDGTDSYVIAQSGLTEDLERIKAFYYITDEQVPPHPPSSDLRLRRRELTPSHEIGIDTFAPLSLPSVVSPVRSLASETLVSHHLK